MTFITNIESECFCSFTQDVSVVHRLLHGALELTSTCMHQNMAFCAWVILQEQQSVL